MMREVGLLFKPEMVRGLKRAARGEPFGKYETRRLVPDKVVREWNASSSYVGENGPEIEDDLGDWWPMAAFARAKDGDTIYAREAYKSGCRVDEAPGEAFFYRADGHLYVKEWPWRPSLHMPRAAARLFMPNIRVRAERLQDITEEGARREGLILCKHGWTTSVESRVWLESARDCYAVYIDAINGAGTWAANPWVFVYSWERVELR